MKARHLCIFLIGSVLLILLSGCGKSSDDSNSIGSENSSNNIGDSSTGIEYKVVNSNGVVQGTATSPEKIKNHDLVLMNSDYSCGAACLATVLSYMYNKNVSESDAIKGLMTYGDQAHIQAVHAFSLWDMKLYVEALGLTGRGYKCDDTDLSYEGFKANKMDGLINMVITPLKFGLYKHFTVLRGVDATYVYLGDPKYGNICMTYEDFHTAIVDNIIFVISKGGPVLKKKNAVDLDEIIVPSEIDLLMEQETVL